MNKRKKQEIIKIFRKIYLTEINKIKILKTLLKNI